MDAELQRRQNTLHEWYADDSALEVSFSRIKAWFAEISRIGHTLGYHHKPAKIFLVTSAENVDLAIVFFPEEG